MCGAPQNDRRPGRDATEATALLLLALTLFFWPAIGGGQVLLPADLVFDLDPLWWPLAPEGYTGPANPLLADQVYQFLPWKTFTQHSLAAGELPLWNPYHDGGLPFVGNAQSAVFSPFNLIGYLAPLHAAPVIAAMLRLLVAGLFTFLFAREIGVSQLGALLAAATFTFSGPLIVWLGYPLASAIVWLPALLLTGERALVRASAPYTIAAGLIVAALFLGGHPATSSHVLLAWAAYALYRALSLGGRRWVSVHPHLLRLAAIAALGGLLAAVQLLPFVEALTQSATLSARLDAPAAAPLLARLFCAWRDWPTAITVLLPQYFGSDLDGSYWFPYSNYAEQNAYAGVLPLALALTAILRRPRHGPTRFFTLLAACCLGVALGLPLLNGVNELPIFNLSSNGRLRLVYAFAVALLASMGLDGIVQQRDGHAATLRVLAVLALAGLLLIGLAYGGLKVFKDEVIRSGRAFVAAQWGHNPYLSRPLEYYNALVEERYEKKLALYHPRNGVMYLPVLIALGWALVGRWRANGRALAWAALGLTVVDLFLINRPFNPTTAPEQVFPTPDAIRFLQQDEEVYRVSATGLILYPNSGMLFGLADARGYDAVAPRRYTDLIGRLEGHYRFHFHSLFTDLSSPLLDLLNVRYALTDQELTGRWELAYEDDGAVKVYRNRDALPRAFVVYRAEVVNGAAVSLERVLAPDFDFRTAVVLEETPADWAEPTELPATPAAVRIVAYQPNRVALTVETAAPGLLVLTDNYAPGWQALVDGQPVPVLVADHAFRAVAVGAGDHQVLFVYRPLSFRIGAAVSLAAMAASLFALLLCAAQRRGARA